jgi:hypothetical protein
MSTNASNYHDRHLAPSDHTHRSVLSSTGMLESAAEALDAIEQEASYTTGNAGLVNDLFGAALYVQSNLEADFFGALPKVDRTGANTAANQPLPLTFRAAYGPPALQTHSEGGSIPSGRTYNIDEVSADVKRSIAVVEQSDLEQLRAELLDGVPLDELTRVDELYQNLAIDRDAVAAGVTANNSGYGSRDKVTELDRVIASGDEETNADDVNGTAFTDGDLDVYDLDRNSDSWADAFVDFNGSVRQLTEDLMDSFLSSFFDFGSAERGSVAILTGRDTADVLADIHNDSTSTSRFVHQADVEGGRESVNDAETIMGIPSIPRPREYKGIPIVANQHAPAHGSLSSIYVVPTDTMSIRGTQVPRIAVEEYAAPYVETAGRGEDQGFLSIGSFENKVLYKMDHEIVCRDFSATGKLRDIEA